MRGSGGDSEQQNARRLFESLDRCCCYCVAGAKPSRPLHPPSVFLPGPLCVFMCAVRLCARRGVQVTSRSIAGPPAAVGSTASSTGTGTGTSSQPATMLLIPLIDLANHCTLGSSGANRSSSSGISSTAHGSGTTTSDGSSSTDGDGSSRGSSRGRSGDVQGRSTPDVLRFRTEGGAAGSLGSGTAGRVVLELVAGQDLEAGQEVGRRGGAVPKTQPHRLHGRIHVPFSRAAARVLCSAS